MRLLAVVALVAGCHKDPADRPCTCTPGNAGTTRTTSESAPMDGAALLARVRKHRQDVEQGKNPRDIKVGDDELRFAIANFCAPCNDWVKDRMTIEDMFPTARLDDAVSAVCMGLVLRDGATVYGDARPRECRDARHAP